MNERRESAPRITWCTADGDDPHIEDERVVSSTRRRLTLGAAVMAVAASVVGATVVTMAMLTAEPVTAGPEPLTVAEARMQVDETASITPSEPATASVTPVAAPVQQASVQSPPAPLQEAAPSEPDVLGSNDARWAHAAVAPASRFAAMKLDAGDLRAYAAARGKAPSPIDDALVETPDEDAEPVAKAAPAVDEPEEEADASPRTGGRTSTIVTDARIRRGPSTGHGVIGTVAAGKQVQVYGCKSWCEISYDGKRGFVYKRFVRGAGGSGESAKARSTQTSKPSVAKAAPAKPKIVAAEGLPGVDMPGVR